MKNQNNNLKLEDFTKDVSLPNEEIIQMIENNLYEKEMLNADNADVNINHLENIFTNETYYLAMKIVPLLERKVLYLSFVENARLNDICKRLKLQKKQVISLKQKGILHFKNNLQTLIKAENLKGGKR